MPKVRIIEMSVEQNGEFFYQKMGQFFASRRIRQELGNYAMSNEPDWRWFVAFKDDAVVGFLGTEPRKNTGFHISVLYVVEAERRQGIISSLLKAALEKADEKSCAVTITAKREFAPILEKYGFYPTSARGKNWIGMKRDKK